MTLEDYAVYYKTKHLPLVLSSLPRKFKSIQVRIVNRDDPFLQMCGAGADPNPSFDSITELQFESRGCRGGIQKISGASYSKVAERRRGAIRPFTDDPFLHG